MRYAALLIATLLAGCLSMPKIIPMTPAPQIHEQAFTPPIGEVHESLIGDPMIVRQDAIVSMGYAASKNYVVPAMSSTAFDPIKQGSKWKVIGAATPDNLVIKNDLYKARFDMALGMSNPYNYSMCFIVTPSGDIVGHTWCDKASDQISPHQWDTPVPGVFEVQGKYYELGSLKQELVYNGKSGSSIKLSYREFINDMARPAFTQELSYDLAEGKTIGFRGMAVDVLDANNSAIKFVIKSPMK